jgi:hypothetical protein
MNGQVRDMKERDERARRASYRETRRMSSHARNHRTELRNLHTNETQRETSETTSDRERDRRICKELESLGGRYGVELMPSRVISAAEGQPTYPPTSYG